jgi:hypothetical protein
VILKIVPKASYDMYKYTRENHQWQQSNAGTEILMRLSEASQELELFSKKQADTVLYNYFLFQKAAGKLINHLRMQRKY